MKILVGLFLCFVFAITAGAVAYASDRQAMYESQTDVAQAQTQGVIAQAQSQSQIAGYQASVDLAGITAQLEIARMQMEMERLANQIELEKVQAMLVQTNAMLAQTNLERQRLWITLVIPSMGVIVLVVVVLALAIVLLRRPMVTPYYPRVTERTNREIVQAQPSVVALTLVGRRHGAERYEVRR